MIKCLVCKAELFTNDIPKPFRMDEGCVCGNECRDLYLNLYVKEFRDRIDELESEYGSCKEKLRLVAKERDLAIDMAVKGIMMQHFDWDEQKCRDIVMRDLIRRKAVK
jgi:hypothetical protein